MHRGRRLLATGGVALLAAAACGTTTTEAGDDTAAPDAPLAPGAAQENPEAGDPSAPAEGTGQAADPTGADGTNDGSGDADEAPAGETGAESRGDGDPSPTLTLPPTTAGEPGTSKPPPSTDDQGDPSVGDGPIDPGLQPFIDDAVEQLATKLDLPASAITVRSARVMQWSDASAGCPQPGMQYAQVLTDGSAIELEAEGSAYWFHSGGSRGPFLCDSPLRTRI